MDLVERLRLWQGLETAGIHGEAADEITRLKSGWDADLRRLDAQALEIAVLKAEIAAGKAFYKLTVKQRDSAWEELDQLKTQSAEPVYAYRRKGLDYFCTCDEERYLELSDKPKLFEVAIFYTHPAPRDEQVETLRRDAERYRWLRERMDTKDVSIFKMRNAPDPEVDEQVDAAIDAAMRKVEE